MFAIVGQALYVFLEDNILPPVTTEQMGASINKPIMEVYKLILHISIPAGIICLVVGILSIALGRTLKSGFLVKSGYILLFVDCLCLISIYMVPLFVGFFNYLGKVSGG